MTPTTLASMLRCRSVKTPYKAKIFITRRSNLHASCLAEELDYRGLLAGLTTSRTKFTQFVKSKRVVYCGLDPTAPALHVGNLLPLLALLHFQIRGHQPIVLLGGDTALIGDPSGRDDERPLQNAENIRENTLSIQAQISAFFENAKLYARKRHPTLSIPDTSPWIINNADWWNGMTFVGFLHSTGKISRVSSMLSKESVRKRLESSSGISFAEFSYQLMQAYDFWHLFKHYNCGVQIGGSDQWGNISAGLDIIRRNMVPQEPDDEKAFGITTPLLTSSSGQKFGKSAGNAIWLSSKKTSVFDFYQFFIRIPDSHVEHYLRLFTLLGPEDIEKLMLLHKTQPESRFAQRELANEVTELIHGVVGASQAQAVTKLFFDDDIQNVDPQDVIEALQSDPRLYCVERSQLVGVPLPKLATLSGLTKSRAESVRLIESGGLYINNIPVRTKDQKLLTEDLVGGQLATLRAGKNNHVILAVQ